MDTEEKAGFVGLAELVEQFELVLQALRHTVYQKIDFHRGKLQINADRICFFSLLESKSCIVIHTLRRIYICIHWYWFWENHLTIDHQQQTFENMQNTQHFYQAAHFFWICCVVRIFEKEFFSWNHVQNFCGHQKMDSFIDWRTCKL